MTNPAAVLARFHEAEGRFFESEGTVMPSWEGILHPDFVLVEPEGTTYGGAWSGQAGLERFLRALNTDWSGMGPVAPPAMLADGDTAVALATLRATARTTGHRVEFSVCQVAKVRDGLLVDTRVFYWTTAELDDALGPQRTERT